MAQLTRDGFVGELNSRGWSRYAPTDLSRYVDWGLRDVQREAKWMSSELVGGPFNFAVSNVVLETFNALGVRQVKKVYLVTDNEAIRLKPMTDEEFHTYWFPQYDTEDEETGTPTHYYVHAGSMWFQPSPDKAYDFKVHYVPRFTVFAGAGTTSGLPERFDEAILAAAEAHCFRRAHEVERMLVAQAEVRRIVLAEIVEDGQLMEERERRVVPHR